MKRTFRRRHSEQRRRHRGASKDGPGVRREVAVPVVERHEDRAAWQRLSLVEGRQDVVQRDRVEVASEQRDLCRRLSGFAQTQRALITGDEPQRLLELLAERQQLLDRLMTVGERLRPLQKQWVEVRTALSDSQVRQAEELIGEVNRLLAGILQIDDADAQLLSARKSMTARALKQVGRGRQAGAAYESSVTATPVRVDWTDE